MNDKLWMAPAFGVIILMIRWMATGKWNYKPPAEASESERKALRGPMALLVRQHDLLKVGGGLGLWLSGSALIILEGLPAYATYLLQGLVVLSTIAFGLALSWRMAAHAAPRRSRRTKSDR